MLQNRPVLIATLATPLAVALIVSGMVVAHAQLRRIDAPHRLVLTAPEEIGCYYSSAWHDGDVFVDHDPTGETLTFTREVPWRDGCTWVSTETLTPRADGSFDYRYAERVVACNVGHRPYPACPRSGRVTVERAPTAAFATMTPQEIEFARVPDATRELLAARACNNGCPAAITR